MSKIPTEHAEQATLVNWFGRSYPEFKNRLFAIPNGAHLAGGAKQRAQQMSKLKAEGLAPGVPDMLLPVARHGYHGLFIEMKRAKGSSTPKEQKDWKQFLTEQGYKAVICKGHKEAQGVITRYLSTTIATTQNG